MKNLQLQNGDTIPMLGLGTWRLKNEEIDFTIRKAIEIGYRHFDCASIYKNEAAIGKALADAISAGDVTREELWITSKLWNHAHQPKDVTKSLQKSLKDLQLSYLNLYLIHWPVAFHRDYEMLEHSKANEFYSLTDVPLPATWEAMLNEKEKGFIKHMGVSNFSISKIETISNELEQPELNQIEIHPYLSQDKLVAFCQHNNIIVTGYKPLGSGLRVTEKMKENKIPSILQHPLIQAIAEENKMSVAQVLIQWQMQRNIVCIPKSSNAKRLKENFDSLQHTLSVTQMKKIAQLNWNFRFVTGEGFCKGESPYSLNQIWK